MRVDNINRIYEAYKVQARSDYQKIAKTNKKDQVALSDTAKDFGTISKMLEEVPDVREDKVKAIKEQIISGTYNVKSEEVAEKMLSKIDIKG